MQCNKKLHRQFPQETAKAGCLGETEDWDCKGFQIYKNCNNCKLSYLETQPHLIADDLSGIIRMFVNNFNIDNHFLRYFVFFYLNIKNQ